MQRSHAGRFLLLFILAFVFSFFSMNAPIWAKGAWVLKKQWVADKPNKPSGSFHSYKIDTGTTSGAQSGSYGPNANKVTGSFACEGSWTAPPKVMVPGDIIPLSFQASVKAQYSNGGYYFHHGCSASCLKLHHLDNQGNITSGGSCGAKGCRAGLPGDGKTNSASCSAENNWKVPDGSPGSGIILYIGITGKVGIGQQAFKYVYDEDAEVSQAPPAPQPEPVNVAGPKANKPLCAAALKKFGLTNSGTSGMTVDHDDIKKQFRGAISKYNAGHSSRIANLGNTSLGMAPLLTWMANQGGSVDFISKHFVFASDKDRKKWEYIKPGHKATPRLHPEFDHVRKGTERQLLNQMYRLFHQKNNKKLSMGDILYLALEQRNGNIKDAMLLAHNTLRSLARVNDGIFTDVHHDLTFFEDIIEPLIDPEPLGRGQNAGAVYHLFGTATVELYSRGSWSLNNIANYTVDFLGDKLKDKMQALMRKIKADPNLELPETRSTLSIFANEFEQAARSMKWASPDDPEKYCYNIIGAQLGAWLHKKFAGRQPTDIGQPTVTIKIPKTAPKRIQFSMSPMDITWEGNGYSMTFHQNTRDFTGFYPLLILPIYEEHDGTWGVAWVDFLGQPYDVILVGTGNGPGHIVSIDLSGKEEKYRAYHLPLAPGRKFTYRVMPESHSDFIWDEHASRRIGPVGNTRHPAITSPTELVGGIKQASTHNKDAVRNGPTVPTVFISKTPIMLESIRTYHWNGGHGSAPGTITLQGSDGVIHGPWQAEGLANLSGDPGPPYLYWIARPRVTLPAGKYRVTVSDNATWATNTKAGNRGFFSMEYQTVKPRDAVPDDNQTGVNQTAPPAATKRYINPMLGEYRLDWCRDWGDNCGKPAADAYCKFWSLNEAISFSKAEDVGRFEPTRVINGGGICDQPHCDSFSEIICQ